VKKNRGKRKEKLRRKKLQTRNLGLIEIRGLEGSYEKKKYIQKNCEKDRRKLRGWGEGRREEGKNARRAKEKNSGTNWGSEGRLSLGSGVIC